MIALEDNAADVIGKAQRGLGVSDSQLAERAGVEADAIRRARNGDMAEQVAQKIASVLGLDASALLRLARGDYDPQVDKIDGLAVFNTEYGDMRVNAYLVWDPPSRTAVAFDSGADCAGMLDKISNEQLTVEVILLTHSHPDHVEDLQGLQQATRAPVYISERESASGAEGIQEGREFRVGALHIRSLLTWGHSRGGM